MSVMANNTPIITTVQSIGAKEQTPREVDGNPRTDILDFYEKHYEDILPIIMDRARQDKRKEVQARLDFGGSSKKFRRIRENSWESGPKNPPVRYRHTREKPGAHVHVRNNDRNVFNRLTPHRKSVLE
ncbi:hypothetical protein Tco_0424475 [Tanacetum coccineum]